MLLPELPELPELLPRAGLDDEPVVERELLPLCWFRDEPPDRFNERPPCCDELLVDEPVVVRETVPLTFTPGRECRPTTVRLSLLWMATAGRRL